jgi:predicted site-specific integrase-resolvase
MEQSEYLSVSGTARTLNRSENTVRLWERQGKIAAIKTETGKRIFARVEVERVARELERQTA